MSDKVVVFDNETKEILAIVCIDGVSICRNDIDYAVYSDSTEPILTENNGKVYYNASKFLLQL